MIKVERKITDKSRKAIDSLKVAKLKNGSYNTPEVNAALNEMFHGKCYICENKEGTSYQIEHLVPHRGDVDLKYDWNNLFLSCAHCNNTKLDRFDPILDCTKENVEELIAFRKTGYFGTDEKLVFEVLDARTETQNTAKLLETVYYGSTPQKEMEARKLRRTLRKEVSKFKEYVREYAEAEDEEREDLKCLLHQELKVLRRRSIEAIVGGINQCSYISLRKYMPRWKRNMGR
ncbi:MAG: HNH endonuclease [Butyrivibrio sp.]|nr:HNH endonuclease [Acetatifactor muris]MCM1559906.1 HNH endonuclease [Butyrivibrio sp.]